MRRNTSIAACAPTYAVAVNEPAATLLRRSAETTTERAWTARFWWKGQAAGWQSSLMQNSAVSQPVKLQRNQDALHDVNLLRDFAARV